jgi:hypothetical protein
MSRKPRNLDAERGALHAAADRLLAGTPLRSTSGRLTATELIAEAGLRRGLRRDTVYGDHKALVEQFAARVKAQSSTPDALRELASENENLKQQLTLTREQLRQERLQSALLRRSVAELTIELDLAWQQLNAAAKVTVLPRAGDRLPDRRAFSRVSPGQPASPTLET